MDVYQSGTNVSINAIFDSLLSYIVMKIVLGGALDVDFINQSTKYDEIVLLGEQMDKVFSPIVYSHLVNRMNIELFCGELFKPHSRPVYYEERFVKHPNNSELMSYVYHELIIDIEIPDKMKFLLSTLKEGYRIIAQAMVKYFEEVKLPLKIRKSFDKDRFVCDLKAFFLSIGCPAD